MSNVATPSIPLEEAEEVFEVLAKKYALLVVGSGLPEDVQDALVAVLPTLTMPQIVHIVGVLESAYASKKTNEVDQQLIASLTSVVQGHQERQAQRNQDLANEVRALSQQVSS
jgi:hypothetical protein